jgi:signal transduction histidine kinase
VESQTDGMRLGLAICKRIVELHGGKIEVESKGGSRFVVDLPFNN